MLGFFRGLNELMLLVTNWIMFFAPLGVFGLVAKTVSLTGLEAFGLLAKYFVVVLGALLILLTTGLAACLGYEAFRAGQAVRVGMVIACRSLTVERSPLLVGEEFIITAEQVRGSEWLSHFDTSMVDAAGEPVAQAMLTLVHTDAPGV